MYVDLTVLINFLFLFFNKNLSKSWFQLLYQHYEIIVNKKCDFYYVMQMQMLEVFYIYIYIYLMYVDIVVFRPEMNKPVQQYSL